MKYISFVFGKFFEFFLKFRKIIISISLFLSIVCFCVFISFILVGNDMCYIPLVVMLVVSSPNMFYRFIDELDDITKQG